MSDEKRSSLESARARKTPRPRRPGRRTVISKLLGLLAESFPKITALLKVARDWSRRKPLWIRIPLYSGVILGAAIYLFGERLLKLPVIAGIHSDVTAYVDDLFAVPLPDPLPTTFRVYDATP